MTPVRLSPTRPRPAAGCPAARPRHGTADTADSRLGLSAEWRSRATDEGDLLPFPDQTGLL